NDFPRLDFSQYPSLTFEKPDLENFPCLNLAYHASQLGGNIPCVMNAANEVAVAQFLHDRIKFNDIPKIIEQALEKAVYCKPESIEEYLEVDKEVRRNLIQSK
ncbi:MAG: 1-deoxy-D-xylulose-5-phosphate reductoisomerase, partial [Bacteroidales bacterium]